MLPDEELTQRITGAAIEVHRALEPGFLESGYGEALAVEFETTGLRFERQKTVPFQNRARKIGEQRLDFLVEGLVAVESKTVQSEAPVFFSFVRLYRKATHLASGLLLNLADLPLELERVGRESSARNPTPHPADEPCTLPAFLSSIFTPSPHEHRSPHPILPRSLRHSQR